MKNRLNNSEVDNGVTFVKFLWEECKPELEKMNQGGIDAIASVVYMLSDRDEILVQFAPKREELKTEKEAKVQDKK